MPPRPHAVVLGLDSITGLQTARILARRGVPVVALAKDLGHYCCRTRVCERIVRAETDSEELIEALERLGPALGERAVLFPCTDMAVFQISLHRKRLEEHYHVVLPAHDVVELLMSKLRFYEHAQANGHPIPRTFILRGAGDAKQAAESLAFPAVLKPALRTPEWDKHVGEKAFKPAGAEELLALYERTAPWTEALVLQEWIPGSEASLYSCNCYLDAGSKALVTFVARKIRQWPPETGISSLGEECQNDVVLEESVSLFEGVGFRGLAYLEMKRHEETGEHFIIEPNVGRPTGRSAIAEAGGVELLYTKYCDVLGLPLPRNRVQRYTGAKWIYARSDLQSAFHYWRRDELTIPEWWRSVRGPKVDAVISRRDPAPFLFELWRGARLLAGSTRGKEARRAPVRAKARPLAGEPAAGLRLEPVGSLEELREEWSELAEHSRNIFATWEWAAIWWKHFGNGRRLLLSACRDAEGRLLGILPLYAFSTRPLTVVRFLGHGSADQLGPICLPEERVEVGRALARELARLDADIFLGEQLPGNEGWEALIGGRVLAREGSPVLRFESPSWDDLLAGWSPNRRSQVRRFERKLEREHDVGYRLVDGAEGLEEGLDTLFALHTARWGESPSAFTGPQAAFHREFAFAAAERGWLRLWLLQAEGRPVSAWYGFRFGGVESYYQAGRDPAWEGARVGLVLLLHTMRSALEDGMREYRFLRGSEGFKYRFANEDPGLATIGVTQGPLGGAALAAGTLLRRRLGRTALRQWLGE